MDGMPLLLLAFASIVVAGLADLHNQRTAELEEGLRPETEAERLARVLERVR